MYLDYFYWQYVLAPRWLFSFLVTLHTALFRMFSVPFMLRTLFAHWRRDIAAYRASSLSGLAMIFAWNQISRVIGFLIRSIVIFLWLISEVLFLSVSLIGFILFLGAPLVLMTLAAVGLVLVVRG
jgi:hypothetical protein